MLARAKGAHDQFVGQKIGLFMALRDDERQMSASDSSENGQNRSGSGLSAVRMPESRKRSANVRLGDLSDAVAIMRPPPSRWASLAQPLWRERVSVRRWRRGASSATQFPRYPLGTGHVGGQLVRRLPAARAGAGFALSGRRAAQKPHFHAFIRIKRQLP